MEEVAEKHPGALQTHWIPMDRDLWRIENYAEFLGARRELLAQAANDFLDTLVAGDIPEAEPTPSVLEWLPQEELPGSVDSEEEELEIIETNIWVVEAGMPEGEFSYDLTDPETDESLAILDLAWPEGLQPGLSAPLALLLNEGQEIEEIANAAGYRYFTDVASFRRHVEKEFLGLDEQPL